MHMRPFLFHRFRDVRNELVQSVKDFRLINVENDSRASKRPRSRSIQSLIGNMVQRV